MKIFTALLALSLPTLAIAGPANYQPAADMAWQPLGPGIEMTPLWQNADKSDMALLLRLAPGYVGIVHGHNTGYNGVTVQGTWVHVEADGTEYVLPVGSAAYQAPLLPHSDNCISEDPCILLIHLEGEYDFFIPE
jgi:anti-sigma factor ChrR (cupin superfamily)